MSINHREIVERIIENINAGRLESARRETLMASFILNPPTRDYLFMKIEERKKHVSPLVQQACEAFNGKIVYD